MIRVPLGCRRCSSQILTKRLGNAKTSDLPSTIGTMRASTTVPLLEVPSGGYGRVRRTWRLQNKLDRKSQFMVAVRKAEGLPDGRRVCGGWGRKEFLQLAAKFVEGGRRSTGSHEVHGSNQWKGINRLLV